MQILLLYLSTLDHIALRLIPILVLALASRRFIMSHSFNRVLYLLVIVHAVGAIFAVARIGPDDAVLNILARIAAYGCIPLWLVVTDISRSTGSSDRYKDGWSTVYRKRTPRPVEVPHAPKIDDRIWANLPVSHVRTVARYTPSGRADARTAARGTA